MAFPLQGIRVLDFSIAHFGNLCTQMLGDMGADVIKIERVRGDSFRYIGGAGLDFLLEGMEEPAFDHPSWLCFNRSKRDLAIDVRQEKGKEVILRLAKGADVVVENFRPGVMERLGLGYEDMAKVNPRIIYCSISGWGETGPLAHRIGGDFWAQAMGGVVSIQGTPHGPPYLAGVAFVDQGGAGIAAFGIMVALFERGKSGMGQHLTTNLLNAVIHMQAFESSGYLIDGSPTFKLGRGAGPVPPMGAYRAKDGDVVTIFGVGPTWPTFCKLLGIEHLEKDPRFESDEKRVEHREELYPLLDEAFSKKARAEWQQIFREARLRCDPCLTYEELFDHPQVAANEMVITMQHPVRGPIRMPGIPVKLKRTPGGPQGPPPLLGQHTKEILVELGYSAQEIDELVEKRVVKVR